VIKNNSTAIHENINETRGMSIEGLYPLKRIITAKLFTIACKSMEKLYS
jgi:hypothetical protein